MRTARNDSGATEGLVIDSAALLALLGDLDSSSPIAFDTEFQRERTYYPKLCLVQIGDGQVVAAVDALAEIDLSVLWRTLGDRTVWLHSGRQDLELLWQVARCRPGSLMDTQIAAGLAGFAPQIGYGPLVAELLGETLAKAHTRADWTRRPLADGALDYALDDVRYLTPLGQALARRLETLGRTQWLEEDCERLRRHDFDEDSVTLARRLKGFGRLAPDAASRAIALARWRESLAQRLDRPRRWVVADDLIIRLAQHPPQSVEDLRRSTEKPNKLLRREGESLLQALRDQVEDPPQQPEAPSTEERRQLKDLAAEIDERAQRLDIATEVVATRSELLGVLRGQPAERLTSGWRSECLKGL